MEVMVSMNKDNFFIYYFEEEIDKNILLLPGFPSLPCKKEVAKNLSKIGFNTIFMNYKGSWSSKGFLSGNPKKEVEEFLKFDGSFKDLFSGEEFNLKKPKYALGFSYGGFVSLLSSDLFEKVVAFAPPISLKDHKEHFERIVNEGNFYRANEESREVLNIELKKEHFDNALVVHGREDKIVDYYKNKEFYDKKGVNYIEIEAGHYPSSLLLEFSLNKIERFLR